MHPRDAPQGGDGVRVEEERKAEAPRPAGGVVEVWGVVVVVAAAGGGGTTITRTNPPGEARAERGTHKATGRAKARERVGTESTWRQLTQPFFGMGGQRMEGGKVTRLVDFNVGAEW
eukprot:Hpha_TRINITY_DN34095_c0_g1::TRINITY_DN34095_c0_g1_i1::g.30585::m.30585